MKQHYLVLPTNRKTFYNYLHKLNYKPKYFSATYIIKSNFPFYVDIIKKEITVIESITVCACAASNKQILTAEEFKSLVF